MAVSSSADLLDLQFLLPATPVFVHPLLLSSNKFRRTTAKKEETEEQQQQQAEKPETNVEDQQRKHGQEEGEEEEQFADPLNATALGQPTTTNGQGWQAKENSLIPKQLLPQSESSTGILTTNRLDNTLAQRKTEQWPLEGLDPELIGHRPWRTLRQRILRTFSGNATDRLTLESSFLKAPPPEARNGDAKQRKGAQRQLLREKRRNILKEHPEPVTKFYYLSQEEWVRKLIELRRILMVKWKAEERLECIKFVTEVAAFISINIASAQFYPAQFVHVTDFLDLFGHLVYERLLARAREERRMAGLSPLPVHFDINDVLEDTRLKARNWFGKVNEMVKLMAPRIYLLVALLPCQRFMDPPGAITENLLELCRAVKQVQHPLISSYLRCYICRVAMRLNSADRAPHWKCLNDWLQTYTQQPTSLLGPAMEWIVQCVSFNAVSYADLHPLWEYCRLPERRPLVLIPMLNALPRLYLGEHALEACRIVTGSEIVTGEELNALGTNLLEAEPPVAVRKPILKAVWKCVMRMASLKHFVACCECWTEFVARHFSANEIDVVLDNLLRRMQQDKHELYQPQLLAILSKIFAHSADASALFAMDTFPRLVDLFRTNSDSREQSALIILRVMVAKHPVAAFTDVDLAYQILSVCQCLHDCIEPSSPTDRVRSVTNLISSSLDRVDLSADPDHCLNFLVSCRADLANIDGLQQYVIRRVQSFTLHICRSVRYTSSRAAFLQACVANQFISIPSLIDPMDRIEYSIHSTQIAHTALTFLQVDAFVDFILDTFDSLCVFVPVPPSSSILRHGTNFLATLTNISSQNNENDEENEPEELQRHFRRFLNFVLGFPWPSSPGSRLDLVRLLIRCLQHLFLVWPAPEPRQIGLVDPKVQLEQLQIDNDDQHGLLLDIYGQYAEKIADALGAELLDEHAADAMYSAGVELLELVAQFGPTAADGQPSLPRALHALAKAVYKRCKRRKGLAERISRLQNAQQK